MKKFKTKVRQKNNKFKNIDVLLNSNKKKKEY